MSTCKKSMQAVRWPGLSRASYGTRSKRTPPMSSQADHGASGRAQGAMTAEEVASNNTSGRPSSNAPVLAPKRPNAFTELMSRSKKAKPLAASDTPSGLREAKPAFRKLDPRDGLGAYIDHPEANPEGRVVEYDDDFVVINDKFPKASVHLLLIPRKIEYHKAHPLHILSTDANFRLEVEKRVARLKKLAALELRRQYGHLSVSDTPYQAALEELMSSPIPPPSTTETVALPAGRHWLSDIVTGVHTHPSMSHLHIHIFSRDMHSPCLKHKKHYLSFNSSFLVRLDEFPLRKGSERFHPGDWPNWDMKCWRCGKNFKNKFAALKVHLDEEFETWAKE